MMFLFVNYCSNMFQSLATGHLRRTH